MPYNTTNLTEAVGPVNTLKAANAMLDYLPMNLFLLGFFIIAVVAMKASKASTTTALGASGVVTAVMAVLFGLSGLLPASTIRLSIIIGAVCAASMYLSKDT